MVGASRLAGSRPTASIRIDAADMLDLIARYDAVRPGLSEQRRGIALGDVRLLAPLPRPRRNIFCVGKNYRDHAHEFGRGGYEACAIKGAEIDDYPAMFTKPGSYVVGPGATGSDPSVGDLGRPCPRRPGSRRGGGRREECIRHSAVQDLVKSITQSPIARRGRVMRCMLSAR
jgi:2-keto-4-pentenoate hydratase/2-oxohepta-3-ene-1,7-dioic acid hydratase in catechol pathway